MNALVIYGSVRSERQGIHAARFVEASLRERGWEVRLIDPAVHRLPLLDRMYKEYPPGQAPEPLETLAGWVRAADAYVIVSGEYNHGVPPALSNTLDHFLEEYFWKPSAIVSYSAGGYGGVRAAMALRAMLPEMGMSSIPSIFSISKIQSAFDEQGQLRDPGTAERARKFFDELEWYARALREARLRDGKQTCPERSFCDALEKRAGLGAEGACPDNAVSAADSSAARPMRQC